MVAAGQHQFKNQSRCGMDCSMLVGQCMYVWYASLLHHPMVLINHVGRPATAAVVEAPTLKLWLA